MKEPETMDNEKRLATTILRMEIDMMQGDPNGGRPVREAGSIANLGAAAERTTKQGIHARPVDSPPYAWVRAAMEKEGPAIQCRLFRRLFERTKQERKGDSLAESVRRASLR